MISLSTDAVAAVKMALSRADRAADGLRLVAEADALEAVTVMMHLDVARVGDVVVEQSGLKLLLDGRSHGLADGLRIDFVTAPGAARFVVEAAAEAGPAVEYAS